MKEQKEFLREKLIDFQREIESLKKKNKDQEIYYEKKLTTMNLNFIELVDAFETIEDNLAAKDESFFNIASKKLMKNMLSIKKKILRILKKNKIEKIKFKDNLATIGLCKIVDTVEDEDLDNEYIKETIKYGYLDNIKKQPIRKAELITIKNI